MALSIDKDSLQHAQNFLYQYLRDTGYSGSLEDGTAINDLLVRGMSLLYTLFSQDVNRAEAYLSLQKAKEHKDLLGDEYSEAIDAILANWFVERKEGIPTKGKLRLVFSSPLDYLALPKDKEIAQIKGLTFYPAVDYILAETDFVSVVNSVKYLDNVYVDIEVVASTPSSTQVVQGDKPIVYLDNIYLLNAEINEDFSEGTAQEQDDVFIERTRKAVTTRELLSRRAIYTVLMDELDTLLDVYVAGHGDPEQLRDVQQFDFVDVHTGNRADIYVHAALSLKKIEAVADSSLQISLPHDCLEVVSILGSDEEEYVYEIVDINQTLWASLGAEVTVRVPGADVGQNFSVAYLYSETLPKVEEILTHPERRVICYDPLIKAKYPIILSTQLSVTVRDDYVNQQSLVYDKIRQSIISHIDSLGTGETFIVSDLLRAVHVDVPEISHIGLPAKFDYTLRDPASGDNLTGAVTDQFTLPTGASPQISWNTVQLYIDADLISFTG